MGRKAKKCLEKERSRLPYQVGSIRLFLIFGERKNGNGKKKADQQDSWIKAKIKIGHFGNENEVILELIRERQIQEQETTLEIAAIRAALIEGKKVASAT